MMSDEELLKLAEKNFIGVSEAFTPRAQISIAASLLVIARNIKQPPLSAAEHQAIADLHRIKE